VTPSKAGTAAPKVLMDLVGSDILSDGSQVNYWSYSFDSSLYDALTFSRFSPAATPVYWGTETETLAFTAFGNNDVYQLTAAAVWVDQGSSTATHPSGTYGVFDSDVIDELVVVTLDHNYKNGTTEVTSQINAAKGETFVKPVDPSRTGYAFSGWYDEAAATTVHDFTKTVTAAFTLYAKWTEDNSHSAGGTAVSWYIVGTGSYVSSEWNAAGGLQMFSNPKSTTDLGLYINVTFKAGDLFDITNGQAGTAGVWYHFDKLASSSKVYSAFASDGNDKNIKVVTAGAYNIYLQADGTIWIEAYVAA
jgi:uncharacterized repeat protein (TIGR02543 family)